MQHAECKSTFEPAPVGGASRRGAREKGYANCTTCNVTKGVKEEIMASNVAKAAVENTVLEATKVIEEQLDTEIERLENLDDDELERLRYS